MTKLTMVSPASPQPELLCCYRADYILVKMKTDYKLTPSLFQIEETHWFVYINEDM